MNPHTPMLLEVYLDASRLDRGQRLCVADTQIPISSSKHLILLEKWTLTLGSTAFDSSQDLPTVYKKCTLFCRALYTYVRLLPAHALCRSMSKSKLNSLRLTFRLCAASVPRADSVGLEQPLYVSDRITEAAFDSVVTPHGYIISCLILLILSHLCSRIFRLAVHYRECSLKLGVGDSTLDPLLRSEGDVSAVMTGSMPVPSSSATYATTSRPIFIPGRSGDADRGVSVLVSPRFVSQASFSSQGSADTSRSPGLFLASPPSEPSLYSSTAPTGVFRRPDPGDRSDRGGGATRPTSRLKSSDESFEWSARSPDLRVFHSKRESVASVASLAGTASSSLPDPSSLLFEMSLGNDDEDAELREFVKACEFAPELSMFKQSTPTSMSDSTVRIP